MTRGWHEPSSILRTHSSAVTSEPHFYLTTSVRCTWSDTHFCVWGKTRSKNAGNIRRYLGAIVQNLEPRDLCTPGQKWRDYTALLCGRGRWFHKQAAMVRIVMRGGTAVTAAPGVMSPFLWPEFCDGSWMFGKSVDPPRQKPPGDDRSTALTITAQTGRKTKLKK